MAYPPQLPRWLLQSIIHHFKAQLSPTHVHVEGRNRPKNDPLPRFEIRYDGPDTEEISNNYFRSVLEINILVLSNRDDLKPYTHPDLIGVAIEAFDAPITFRRHTDGDEIIDCDSNHGQIIATGFTLIEQTGNLLGSTVESIYEIYFNGTN
jgi:hypothetical protein